MLRPVRYRTTLYLVMNVLFVALACAAYATGGSPNARLLYLILLFALCSTSALDLDGLNGRFSLLAMFMLVYFVSFGVVDFNDLG